MHFIIFLYIASSLFFVKDPDELFTRTDAEPYIVEADNVKLDETETGRVSHLLGNVKITHGKTEITAEEGFVYEDEKMAKVVGEVKIDDEGTIITSEVAKYYREERKAVLVKSVELVEGEQVLTTDSLVYYKEKKQSIAKGNVVLIDRKQKTEVTGDYGKYDFVSEEGFMTGNPELILEEKDKRVTITGDTLRIKRKENFMSCNGNVTVYEDSITATAGYLEYFSDSERIHLTYEPVVLQEGKSSLSGVSIEVFLKKREIVKTIATVDARGDYFFSDGGSNEVVGDTITIFFTDGKAERIVVTGNANGVYKSILKKEKENE
jgi:lipopolysaccharide export system protein LptA